MKKNTKSNSNCPHYFSEDGKFYCYKSFDSKENKYVTVKVAVENIPQDVINMLKESDHEMNLNNLYQNKLCDPLFEKKKEKYIDVNNDYALDPWDSIDETSSSAEDCFFAEPEPENPQAAKVRKVIENECTEAQKDFYFMHFGMCIKLEEMRQTEAAKTGKLPSAPAMTCRKNKIIDKVAKTLGVNRVKRIKKSK